MGYQLRHTRCLAGLAAGMVLLLAALPVLGKSRELTVGVVPQFEARILYSIWQPLLAKLSQRTGYHFSQLGAPNIAAFEKAFSKGEYDIAYMNPYHYILAARFQGYVPLVRDVGRSLKGVLVVDRNSGISSARQLEGRRIAFPSPNALGASLQMRQELHDHFGLTFTPEYVKTHDSVYLNVLLGKTAAGGGVEKTLERQPRHYRERLVVIHTTRPVASHPIVAHPRLDPEILSRIRKALLDMGRSQEGRAVLARIPIVKIGRATAEDYAPLRAMALERFYVSPE